MNSLNPHNKTLQAKYALTAWWYDLLDYPWERQYRLWRPKLLEDLTGNVLEAGVGTGRNLAYYPSHVYVTGIELSHAMLRKAHMRAKHAVCSISLMQEDATLMNSIPSDYFDWIVSTFMCCVMSDDLQAQAIQQFVRVLKPGGKFRLLEMVYSKNPEIRRRQERFAPFVQKVYGARFDRHTLSYLHQHPDIDVSKTSFLKDDTYLLIEGKCIKKA